ncbi:hypothetical protein NMY22_g2291 [Coprinellus aureogranulatus]|nr:hypothetical protein NMY22_g2291 [Coprinellus aureogranulatus]
MPAWASTESLQLEASYEVTASSRAGVLSLARVPGGSQGRAEGIHAGASGTDPSRGAVKPVVAVAIVGVEVPEVLRLSDPLNIELRRGFELGGNNV